MGIWKRLWWSAVSWFAAQHSKRATANALQESVSPDLVKDAPTAQHTVHPPPTALRTNGTISQSGLKKQKAIDSHTAKCTVLSQQQTGIDLKIWNCYGCSWMSVNAKNDKADAAWTTTKEAPPYPMHFVVGWEILWPYSPRFGASQISKRYLPSYWSEGIT